MGRDALPLFLAGLVAPEPDDRPVPVLGLGDHEATVALLAAMRSVVVAETPSDIVSALARFSVDLGGELVPATRDNGTAIPLDIALGAAPPVLVDADHLSIARMRLEQLLPSLVEDARCAVSRLRALEDLQPTPGKTSNERGRHDRTQLDFP